MDNYKPRIVDELLQYRLEEVGAVLIEGPKWCGKTTTAEQHAKSILYLANPANLTQNLELARINPSLILEGATPRLIDEWQLAPELWDAVRFEVDHRRKEGQFILTGSAVPPKGDKINHTGTGRFAWLSMRPMSLWESGDSSGDISLKALFQGESIQGSVNQKNLTDIAFLTCRGGWPASIGKSERAALRLPYNYLDAVVRSDVSRVDNTLRDPERIKSLLRSYARLQGAQASAEVIRDDMGGNENDKPALNTIYSYISALEKIFVIENMKAWNPNLRSKTTIRSSDTRYFVDPSIAAAALGIGPQDLINDLNTFELLFETLCVRDLRVYADSLDGNVYHYRDKSGLECDTVVHLRNGDYGLIEIKLGGDNLIEHGVSTLTTLASKIDTDKMKKPAFLMVLTAVGNYAYQRKDGIWIVPITCLKN